MDGICAQCGATYSRPPSLMGRYCSKRCAYDARRKERTTHRRIRRHPSHPLAGKGGYVSAARVVLYDAIGPGQHPCHWCEAPVRWTVGVRGNVAGVLVVDHLDDDPTNDDLANLVPSCARCNGTRTQRVTDAERFITKANGQRLRAVERTCENCGHGFLAAVNQVAAGRGRFCSRSCARRFQWSRVGGAQGAP